MTNPLTPVADRLGKLVRLLGSDKDGEVLATVQALRRTLTGAGADIHVLATMIENPTNGGVVSEQRPQARLRRRRRGWPAQGRGRPTRIGRLPEYRRIRPGTAWRCSASSTSIGSTSAIISSSTTWHREPYGASRPRSRENISRACFSSWVGNHEQA